MRAAASSAHRQTMNCAQYAQPMTASALTMNSSGIAPPVNARESSASEGSAWGRGQPTTYASPSGTPTARSRMARQGGQAAGKLAGPARPDLLVSSAAQQPSSSATPWQL